MQYDISNIRPTLLRDAAYISLCFELQRPQRAAFPADGGRAALQLMQRWVFLANFIIPPAAELGVDIAIWRVWSPVNSSCGRA